MIFHLLGLCHLPTSREYSSCAFTNKNIKLAKMLCSLDSRNVVYLYGVKTTAKNYELEEYVNSNNFHFVETHNAADIAGDYGTGDKNFETGYNWKEQDFKHDLSSTRKPSTLKFYKNASEHINKIKKPDDFLLNSMGYYYKPVADAVSLFLHCEHGIGYRGSYKGHFRAFESTFLQNFTYGSENPSKDMDGSYYDRVIPNYFDPSDFEYSAKKGDYYLFIGRLIKRKGILTAVKTCEAIGAKLIIAGQGGRITGSRHLTTNHPTPEFDISPSIWEYVGYADIEKRKKLMSGALATFVPSKYQENFGGVHVESRLSGTPVLTTNFGVFPGTVENGLDGYRCDTLDDFIWAAKECRKIEASSIRKRAERYLLNTVKWEFQKWFEDLYYLYESTADPARKGWHRIREKEPSWRKNIYYNNTP